MGVRLKYTAKVKQDGWETVGPNFENKGSWFRKRNGQRIEERETGENNKGTNFLTFAVHAFL